MIWHYTSWLTNQIRLIFTIDNLYTALCTVTVYVALNLLWDAFKWIIHWSTCPRLSVKPDPKNPIIVHTKEETVINDPGQNMAILRLIVKYEGLRLSWIENVIRKCFPAILKEINLLYVNVTFCDKNGYFCTKKPMLARLTVPFQADEFHDRLVMATHSLDLFPYQSIYVELVGRPESDNTCYGLIWAHGHTSPKSFTDFRPFRGQHDPREDGDTYRFDSMDYKLIVSVFSGTKLLTKEFFILYNGREFKDISILNISRFKPVAFSNCPR